MRPITSNSKVPVEVSPSILPEPFSCLEPLRETHMASLESPVPPDEQDIDPMDSCTLSLSYSSAESSIDIPFLETTSTVAEKSVVTSEYPTESDGPPKLQSEPTTTPEIETRSPSSSSRVENDVSQCHTIDHLMRGFIVNTVMDVVSCPCCQQIVSDGQRTLNEPPRIARSRDSLLACDSDTEDDEEEENAHKGHDWIDGFEDDMLPGTLGSGVSYIPRDTLVSGWLHKKGTGKDWLGSRSWKARWARLVNAKVESYACDVPLLLIYWHPSAPYPSTVLMLDSTVVIPVDIDDEERWNAYRFEIRHATTRENATIPVTRTFTAPKKARDEWVFAISDALLAYEKEKAQFKRVSSVDTNDSLSVTRSPGSPRSMSPAAGKVGTTSPETDTLHQQNQLRNPTYDEVWTGERFITAEVRKALSPPSSPSPPERTRLRNHSLSPERGGPRLPRPPSAGRAGSMRPQLPRPLLQPQPRPSSFEGSPVPRS